MKRLVIAPVDPMDSWSGTECDLGCGDLGWWTLIVEERDVDVDEAPVESVTVCGAHREDEVERLTQEWLTR